MREGSSRRRFLGLLGASAVTGLAGCSDLGLSGGDGESVSDGASGGGGDGGTGGSDGGGNENDAGTPTATATPTENDGAADGQTPTETASPSQTEAATATPGSGTPADVGSVAGGPGAIENAYPQWQYDAANTATGDTAGPGGQPSIAWGWPADPGESPRVWSFAATESTVFASRIVGEESPQARVVALDANSGDVYWQRDLGEGTGRHGDLALAEGSVYLIAGRSLFSLEAATGETEWSVDHGSAATAPVVADGTVYTSDNSTLGAYATSDGSQRWSHTPEVSDGLMFVENPAVRDGRVFVGAQHLQALSPGDGSVQWTAEVETEVTGAPTVGPDRVYVPTDAGETFGFDVADGSRTWQSSEMSEAFSYEISPALVGDTLYLLTDDRIAAVSRSDASVQWTVEGGFGDSFSTPTVADGAIYTSFVSSVQARSTDSGDQFWSFTGNASASSGASHPVVVDGTVYLRDGNRQLLALRA